jgi:NAD(P)-dependent dehydrogenase (short-subunit alcohol dehydrogenase family)
VIAAMRSPDKRHALMEKADAAGVGGRIEAAFFDVADEAAVKAAIDDVLTRRGRIDCLVNNAGFAVGGFAEELSPAEWRSQFDTNVFGLVTVTRAVLPHMRERGSGHIINISSVSGAAGFPGLAAYCASKFAVEGFSESLRLEMLPYGVYVSVVEPGAYKTDIWQKALDAVRVEPGSAYAGKVQRYKAKIAAEMENARDPAEVARLIARIALTPKPGFRYASGKGTGAIILLKRWLPWPLWERLAMSGMKRYY